MINSYPEKIKSLPAQKGKVDTSSKYMLEANDCKILFASYEPGTTIPPPTNMMTPMFMASL